MQTTSTALANGRSRSEERLARWLLMADDRIDGNSIPLTHEFLGLMLGTHRPGVTRAIQALEEEGLIAARRRGISILNRKALEKRVERHLRPSRDLRTRSRCSVSNDTGLWYLLVLPRPTFSNIFDAIRSQRGPITGGRGYTNGERQTIGGPTDPRG